MENNSLKILPTFVLAGLRFLVQNLSNWLGLCSDQELEFNLLSEWGKHPSTHDITQELVYYQGDTGAWCICPSRVLVWGVFTVVLERAPDGGGTTHVFMTSNQITGEKLKQLADQWGSD